MTIREMKIPLIVKAICEVAMGFSSFDLLFTILKECTYHSKPRDLKKKLILFFWVFPTRNNSLPVELHEEALIKHVHPL